LLFACACLSGAGLVTAASGALPDSQLYPFKLATEDVRLWLAPAQDEPTLHLRFAQWRLGEAQALAERGRFDVTVLTALTEETAAALAGIETLPPKVAEPVLQDVLQVTAEQERVLSALIAGAPASEQGEFARALQASSAHRARALQLMATLRPLEEEEEPGESGQATLAPGPTPPASITAWPSWTPEPPVPSPIPTIADESGTPTGGPQPTTTVGLATTPGPTGAPQPTSVPLPTRAPAATPKPGATTGPTETSRPLETLEPTETPIPPAATATPGGQGCVYSLGYWKNHPDAWPVNSLALGNETYVRAELLDLSNGPAGGDTSLILARQLIAARLNVANGADHSIVAATIGAANTWLANYAGKLPYDVSPSLPEGQAAVALADTLERYNNGVLPGGPPNCP